MNKTEVSDAENIGFVVAEIVVDQLRALLTEFMKELKTLFIPRREISRRIKVRLLDDVKHLGGFCPMCHRVKLVEVPTKNYDWDHFRGRNRIKAHEVWPICKGCHATRTNSQHPDDEGRLQFEAFHDSRMKLPGAQASFIR